MTALYIMPAEWEKHTRVWLIWPHNTEDWSPKITIIARSFSEMIRLITQSERVGLLVKDAQIQEKALAFLHAVGVETTKIDFLFCPTNFEWMRDNGGIYVADMQGKQHLLQWRFNAWAKYKNWQKDACIPPLMASFSNVPLVQPLHHGRHVVLEGGSLDVNGKGWLLTTEECLQSPVQCRNKGFTKTDYEEIFMRYLGAHNVIWLGNGIAGDDTHGHVDDIARFVDENTIVAVREYDKNDINFHALEDNWQRLQQTPFKTIALPTPQAVYFRGARLPASYANFLITNTLVLVPTFNDPADYEALHILKGCFPDRKVVGTYARDLVMGLGAIHCLTQQEPMQ